MAMATYEDRRAEEAAWQALENAKEEVCRAARAWVHAEQAAAPRIRTGTVAAARERVWAAVEKADALRAAWLKLRREAA